MKKFLTGIFLAALVGCGVKAPPLPPEGHEKDVEDPIVMLSPEPSPEPSPSPSPAPTPKKKKKKKSGP